MPLAGGNQIIMKIYFPITANILTVGHIKCLGWLNNIGDITIGLLTAKALRGYKEEWVKFKDRKYILEHLSIPVKVVSQNSLDPYENIKKYKPDAIASGDGWEKVELEAIKKFKIKKINIPLPKNYSSSDIKNKMCRIKII